MAEQEIDRNAVIGGSDIAAVMGVSRWKTPLRLYAEKVGDVQPDDLSENEAVQLGSELEDFVARRFTKLTGIKVRRAPCRYYSREFPYMTAQVDRLVEGEDDLLECKTASAWKEKEWEGEDIPIEYVLQVQWQLMITKRQKGYIAVLIGGNKFRWKEIIADPGIHAKMTEAAEDFHMRVERRIPPAPMADDNKFMVQLFPKAGADVSEATQDVENAIALLQQTKAQIIELEKTKDEIEAKLKAVIGTNQGIETPIYIIKWIDIKGSTYTVTKPDSRQLRVSKKKGAAGG